MNNKTPIFIVLVIVIAGGLVWFLNGQQRSGYAVLESGEMMEKASESDQQMMEPEKGDAMMESEAMTSDTMMKGGYADYDASKLAFAEKGKVVLFFKADWCPYCKALDADITKNLSQIPSDVMILKVNYDTAADLKKKYNVLGQHTFVQVDKDGTMNSAWRESNTLSELLGEIK